jgi:hyaluronan synthase
MVPDSPNLHDAATDTARGRRVPIWRQILNLLGCLLALPCYYLTAKQSRFPVTLDILITISLAEINRFVNEGRRMAFYSGHEYKRPPVKSNWEKIDLELQPSAPRLDCMAAVVGWREDPALFAKAMESYKSARSCVFLLVGIDGDEPEDQDMVKVFNKA